MRIPLRLISIVFLFVSSLSASAQERYEFYNGVRQMGMGGAAIAVVNDETSLLSNPAALGKLRDHFLTVIDPEIEGNLNLERTLGLEFYKGLDPQFNLDQLRDQPGRPIHLKGQIFPSLVFKNFGVGIHGKYIVDAEVDSAGTAYQYNYLNDWTAVTGFNFSFYDGILKIGGNLRYTNRREVRRSDLDVNSTDLTLNDLAQEGIGVGSDVGVLVAAPVDFLPTLALVWRDVGDTSYSLDQGIFSSTQDRPDDVKNTLDMAFALFPIHAAGSRSTWTIEIRDVLDRSDSMLKRLHAGYEFNYADALFFRLGLNQRYWTAGFELARFNSQFQLATYGEEIGVGSQLREDRRYVLKYSLRF